MRVLPAGDKFAADANTKIATDEDGIDDGWMGLDIGPESVRRFAEVVGRAQTVLWNGPMGVFEMDAFGALPPPPLRRRLPF